MKPKHDKMTRIIDFKRQLYPRPPRRARPHFCYIDTLIFYKGGTCEVLWEQHIPECNLKSFNNNEIYNMHVKYDRVWGWCLHFSASHKTAERIWKYMSIQRGDGK